MARVAVTGMGIVSPVGNDVATFWASLLAGRSGVGFITEFSTEKLRSDVCASVRDFDVSKFLSAKDADVHGRVTHLSVAAAVEAVGQAKLEGVDPTRVGVLFSTGQGAVDVFEQQIKKGLERGPRAISPYFIPSVMLNAPAAVIATRWGFMGPSYNIASACATGTHSIATSAMMILAGDADVMIAGGAESATRIETVAGFGNARALARSIDGDPTRASRPYDVRRHGFVMGEGAGALVLEAEDHARARGVKPLAFVNGWGSTTDANHVTRPHPEGKGLALALAAALRRAGISRDEVGYLNPHATSTPQGDVAEFLALKTVLGERLKSIPISATKSMIGHLLGGAGAAETIATVCALRDGTLHPSINVDELDPVFEIDLVRGGPRKVDARHAVKLSAGFGGHNCVLVIERG